MKEEITPIISFNHGMGDKHRVKEGIRCGILYVEIIMLAGSILLELLAEPFVGVFRMSHATAHLCILAIRIITPGFLFAGANIAIQGVFQALGCGISSLVVSLLRLCVIVLPLAWVFTQMSNPEFIIWFSFPIAEATALLAAAILMMKAEK